MTAVRVGSFNVRTSTGHDGRNRWVFRRRACLAAIAGLDADLVGLQEVRPGPLRAVRRRFGAVVGDGREADGSGEHASVVVGPAWAVESVRTRWLSPTPDVPGSTGWGAHHPRVATLALLRRGDVRLGIANTHPDHASPAAREQGARLLADWLRDEGDRPWVITGDLNAPPDSPPVATLLAAGFTDALAGVAGGTEHAFTGATDRLRIDYVLAGAGVTVQDARIVTDRPGGRLPSDHWPVVADLVV